MPAIPSLERLAEACCRCCSCRPGWTESTAETTADLWQWQWQWLYLLCQRLPRNWQPHQTHRRHYWHQESWPRSILLHLRWDSAMPTAIVGPTAPVAAHLLRPPNLNLLRRQQRRHLGSYPVESSDRRRPSRRGSRPTRPRYLPSPPSSRRCRRRRTAVPTASPWGCTGYGSGILASLSLRCLCCFHNEVTSCAVFFEEARQARYVFLVTCLLQDNPLKTFFWLCCLILPPKKPKQEEEPTGAVSQRLFAIGY